MHFLKHFNVLASICIFTPLLFLIGRKVNKTQRDCPIPIPEAEPSDPTSILTPSEEEIAEDRQVQGLSRKQHFSQYVQVAAELGEAMPLGEDVAKVQTSKAIEYLRGAAHLREAAWKMTGAGLHQLHMALAGSPTYKVFEVLQEHFLSEVQ